MGQGRVSAKGIMAVGLAIMCIMVIIQPALGAMVPVGWTFNMANWSRGKSFRAGDVLAFNYSPQLHNVVPVSQAGYNSCNARGARASRSGRDTFRLRKGPNYFICSVPGHCQGGMKIAVNAA